MNRTSLQYIERNREELRNLYPTFELFKDNFEASDAFIAQLIENGEKEDIPYNEEQMERSRNFIKLQIKALIARDLWDTNEYFRIIDQENAAIRRAVEIIRTPGEYERILRQN
jgi:carboxyl-terminal processing protease